MLDMLSKSVKLNKGFDNWHSYWNGAKNTQGLLWNSKTYPKISASLMLYSERIRSFVRGTIVSVGQRATKSTAVKVRGLNKSLTPSTGPTLTRSESFSKFDKRQLYSPLTYRHVWKDLTPLSIYISNSACWQHFKSILSPMTSFS